MEKIYTNAFAAELFLVCFMCAKIIHYIIIFNLCDDVNRKNAKN